MRYRHGPRAAGCEFLNDHPYDINADGLVIWPHGQFRQELRIDLSRKGLLRPAPADAATAAGLQSVERSLVLFFESRTLWEDWVERWTTADGRGLPQACTSAPRHPMLGRIE